MNNKMGTGIKWYENLVYYIINLSSFFILWIAKIVIKKAIIEAIGKINFTIIVDNKGKTVGVKNIIN
jgi:hypothetical protein